jgi:hypothetical protein
MNVSSPSIESDPTWRSRFKVLFLIATVVYFAHYLRMYAFGLYEDDYWAIAPNFTRPLNQLPDLFLQCFRYWPQGRPLNHSLPTALSAIGYKLGGLPGIYGLAYAWLTLNSALVYAIVRRLLSGPSALLATFVYVLFPADATKNLLVHASHVQGSMTFLLAGLLLWLWGGVWRWVSYPVAALSLLSYESAFLPFLAAPLLWAGDRKSTWRTWLWHLTLCGIIVAAVAYIRLHTGDTRAGGVIADPWEAGRMVLTSLYLGPLTSLRMMGKGAWLGTREVCTAGIASAVVVACFVYICRPLGDAREQAGQALPRVWPSWLDHHRTVAGKLPWWWIFIAALLMLCGSYALTLTNYPPTQEFGRLTSTHVAAGWGMALGVAALMEGARRHFGRHAIWLTVAVSVWVGALFLYQDFIQREYVRAWNIQRNFWYQVGTLAPEAAPGWTIIVTGSPAAQSPIIASNSWADFCVGSQLFNPDPFANTLAFAHFANTPAFAHLGMIGSLVEFRHQVGGWEWKPRFWGGPFESIDPRHLVVLNSELGVLSRVQFVDTPVGRLESTAPAPNRLRTNWPTTPLTQLFFPEIATEP